MYSVPPDGNCFFFSLPKLNYSRRFQRQCIFAKGYCNYIVQNWSLWKEKVLNTGHNKMTIEMYVATMVDELKLKQLQLH